MNPNKNTQNDSDLELITTIQRYTQAVTKLDLSTVASCEELTCQQASAIYTVN